MPTSAAPSSRSNILLWVLLFIAICALGIDLVDGHPLKTIGTLGMTLGIVGLLLHRITSKRLWMSLTIFGTATFIGTTIYRMVVYQGWM